MDRLIRLAGKEYTVSYTNRSRRQIETIRGKGLMECVTSGMLEDQATIIWAGLTHKYRSLQIAKVAEMLEEDRQHEGAVNRAVRSLLEEDPWGRPLDPAAIRRLAGRDEDDAGYEESESGKDEPISPQGG